MSIATYAVQENNSFGRQYYIEEAHDRDPFERDRTRILHSSAFRRLQYKTQVFANHEGDNFRTRLTHSLEVAQIARSIAKALNLNETLAETLALAHDLGHAPFGHQGQDVLDDLMKSEGGFEHNFQTLRIGVELESPYPDHPGLNLTYETMEGMLKHCSDSRARMLIDSGDDFMAALGERFLNKQSPSLEAQVVDLADSIAYLHADMEDAINMGVLDPVKMSSFSPKFSLFWAKAQIEHVHLKSEDPRVINQTIRNMMASSIHNVIESSLTAIADSNIETIDDVRNSPILVQFSYGERKAHADLKKASRELIYEHPLVVEQREGQDKKIRLLFDAFQQHPEAIETFSPADERSKSRQVCDAIACLTDRGVDREIERMQKIAPDIFEEKTTQKKKMKR